MRDPEEKSSMSTAVVVVEPMRLWSTGPGTSEVEPSSLTRLASEPLFSHRRVSAVQKAASEHSPDHMDELSEEDKLVVERARKIERYLSQPFFVAEVLPEAPTNISR